MNSPTSQSVRSTITRDELMQLPILRYEGMVHQVTSATDMTAALDDACQEHVIGFDTEARPTFQKGQKAHAPSLVQIATTRAVYLFQLSKLDNAPALAELLSHPRVVKTGIALGRDLAELQQLFPFPTANIVDLGDVAKRHGISQTGVRNLAGLFLGGRITKSARTTNWARQELSSAQIQYAATDAWVCREIYLKFESLGWFA